MATGTVLFGDKQQEADTLDLHPYRDAVTVTVAPTLTLARTRTLTL